jgi:hypothetical protein
VIHLKNPSEGVIKKIRGQVLKGNSVVNPKDYLEMLFKVEERKGGDGGDRGGEANRHGG